RQRASHTVLSYLFFRPSPPTSTLFPYTTLFRSYDPGFSSTCSTKSAITYIDGDAGVLLYRGYPVAQLAEKCSFIEVAYLILNGEDRKSTRLNSSHVKISYAVFCLKKKRLSEHAV